MSGHRVDYDEKEARATERAYRGPEITAQRMVTLQELALRAGEYVLDVGVGPGLLAFDMAQMVGAGGRVVGVDKAPAMVAMAAERCVELPQVEVGEGDARELRFEDHSFDAAVCTQVLLYVDDVAKALSEMHRVLKPGGRVLIIETDWRGLVLSSSLPELTETMIEGWDAVVASPRLPPVMEPMLRQAGFAGFSVSAVPVLSTNYAPGGYAHSMLKAFSNYSVKQGSVSDGDAEHWLDDLSRLSADGAFFFCMNRFMFTATRV